MDSLDDIIVHFKYEQRKQGEKYNRKNKTTKDYNNILEIPSGSEEFFSSLITKQNDNRLFFLTSYRNSLSEKSKLEIDYGSLPSESFDNL